MIFLRFAVGLVGDRLELSLPMRALKLDNTYTLQTNPAPQAVGSYSVLGYPISNAGAAQLLQTPGGQTQLAPENDSIEITDELIQLGRDSFDRETFGNEYFFTNVMSVLNGPINLTRSSFSLARVDRRR